MNGSTLPPVFGAAPPCVAGSEGGDCGELPDVRSPDLLPAFVPLEPAPEVDEPDFDPAPAPPPVPAASPAFWASTTLLQQKPARPSVIHCRLEIITRLNGPIWISCRADAGTERIRLPDVSERRNCLFWARQASKRGERAPCRALSRQDQPNGFSCRPTRRPRSTAASRTTNSCSFQRPWLARGYHSTNG